ncbi:aldehyde dehydrogenase family protein [Rossellomorea aquimaris]|uniref:aldehyde dehydrogenase family protein n=1 Tax=Rossellomorea aquimaris TaxID=189382 RepID=UPI001CD72812|nr:aldehyde dehydrogenase family protein [Rossellomorea aquimaris]MCA1055196.1 aldehyde dehydrogenase family protein [Rossellomorea aquimaris]
MGSIATTRKYGLFVEGQWKETSKRDSVFDKYSGNVIGTVSVSMKEDVDAAVESAKKAVKVPFSPYERYTVLKRAAEGLMDRQEELAVILAEEVGKPISESRGEVARAAQTLEISAEEAKRIHGEGIPVEAAPGSENRQAYTKRVPVGVIAAITPFNVPLNLACHKVGPAIAAGNSVILKPAEVTPLTALVLAEVFEAAGLPQGRLHVLTGEGAEIGGWLLDNQDVNMFTFTGSPRVGQLIREKAGLRKVALELGNNSATIVHKDANVAEAAAVTAQKSFNNAGQVCISVQRVYVHEEIYEEFLEKMKETANALVETGGKREGVFYQPTILTNVHDDMKVCRQEVFGPVVAVMPYGSEDEVTRRVNDSEYGLQAGLFTNSLSFAMKAADEIEVGVLIINDTSGYRVDQMPYGGVKKSGSGKEGPKYAIEEMTEERIVVFNL